MNAETGTPPPQEAIALLAGWAAQQPDGRIVLDLSHAGVRCVLVREECTGPVQTLSQRERQIARLVAAGHSNRAIAGALAISSWTVGTHLRRIFAKLGVTTRAAMVAQARDLLLSP